MKAIFLMMTLVSWNSFATKPDCQKLKSDMNVLCEALSRQCTLVESCLIRKDTCTEGKAPTNVDECSAVHLCSKSIESKMPSNERCEYQWAEAGSMEWCRVKTKFWFFEGGCPGRIDGLLKTMAYGFDSSLGHDYTCKSANAKYKKMVDSCQSARKEFAGSCIKDAIDSSDDLKLHGSHAPKPCEVSEKFDSYKFGDFKMDGVGIEQFQGNRRSIGKDVERKGKKEDERSKVVPH